MAKRMIFTLAVMDAVGHNFHGSWRHPQSRAKDYKTLDLWLDLAVKAEKARIDGLFFTDHLGIKGEYKGSQDIIFEMGVNLPIADPVVMIPALAHATEHLGFMFTSSVIQQHPFVFARTMSTLDHLTGGRVGWNVVTSANESAYRNLGLPGLLSHAERYAWAEEYVEVVYKLWEGSWEEDAVVADPARGVYADPAKVHKINHVGERYRVEGFHLMEPSPQRTPMLYQAGGSPPGLAFASRHAEVMFIAAMTPEAAGQQIAKVRTLAQEHGRRPDDIQFFQGLTFVIGSTEAEAQRKMDEFETYRSHEAQTAYWTSLTGMDLGQFDPETRLEDIVETVPGIRGAVLSVIAGAPAGTKPTVRDFLTNAFKPSLIVGTPESVADKLAVWQTHGVDGIQIMSVVMPGSYDEFFEHAVPVLQQRGLMQTEYAPGTLREKTFPARGRRLPDTHPAARYRNGFSLTQG